MHLERTVLANCIKSKATNNGFLAFKTFLDEICTKVVLQNKCLISLAGHSPHHGLFPFYVQASVPRYSG